MKLLYIVEMDNGWDYDDHGTEVLGVFTTLDKAIQAAKYAIVKAGEEYSDVAFLDRTFAVIHHAEPNKVKERSKPTIVNHDLTITTQKE